MSNHQLITFGQADELTHAVATAWLDEIELAHRMGAAHNVALSGGRIAQQFFTATVAEARRRGVAFDGVHFFWADERCVPPDDVESNYRLAAELLLEPLQIAPGQIHRIRGEDAPENAAAEAETGLRMILRKNEEGRPVLDLVLLGMGEDGHIASLFPPAPANIMDTDVSFLVVRNSPKPPPTRISLSYQAIIDANQRWVLVSGATKGVGLRESLTRTGKTPLGRLIAACPVKIFSDLPQF
jgi:6-phosphogluconolactonase